MTHEDLCILLIENCEAVVRDHPDWLADNFPERMAEENPVWMYHNRPEWFRKHRPKLYKWVKTSGITLQESEAFKKSQNDVFFVNGTEESKVVTPIVEVIIRHDRKIRM
jgi:hypothetical protein